MSDFVIVTGASGFIGQRLVELLLEGGYRVGVLARKGTDLSSLRFKGRSGWDVFVDNGDQISLNAYFLQSRPVVVFHLASLFLVKHQAEQVSLLVEANILFGARVVEAAAQSGCRHFVTAGTNWQTYQNRKGHPVNLYAATKQAFEAILAFYSSIGAVSWTALHLSDSYGPNDSRSKVLNLIVRTIETGQELDMSPGDQKLDLVHVDDIGRAFIHAWHLLAAGKIRSARAYGVRSGRPVSLRQLVALVARQTNKAPKIRFGVLPYREREVFRPSTVFRTLPGWKPELELNEGLRTLVGGSEDGRDGQ